jgi:hypothetical protein
MVGKRTWADGANDAGPRRALARAQTEAPRKPAKPKAFRRYADVADADEEDRQRDELRDRLIEAVDRGDLERYRVSDEDVSFAGRRRWMWFLTGVRSRR